MTLESLLKSWKLIDEEVLRLHTQVAKHIEDKKEISKNTLSDRLTNVALFSALVYSVNNVFLNPTERREVVDNTYYGIKNLINILRIGGVGSYLNFVLYRKDFEDESSSESIAVNPITHYAKKISRILRLPGFVAGLAGLGYSFKELLAANSNISDSVDLLVLSGFVTIGASALYMKDADPKLLDKPPLLKRIYNLAEEKAGLTSPRPRPVPQPVPNLPYATLDSHMHSPN